MKCRSDKCYNSTANNQLTVRHRQLKAMKSEGEQFLRLVKNVFLVLFVVKEKQISNYNYNQTCLLLWIKKFLKTKIEKKLLKCSFGDEVLKDIKKIFLTVDCERNIQDNCPRLWINRWVGNVIHLSCFRCKMLKFDDFTKHWIRCGWNQLTPKRSKNCFMKHFFTFRKSTWIIFLAFVLHQKLKLKL